MIKRFCDACKLEITKPDLLVPKEVSYHIIELTTHGFNTQKPKNDGKYEICYSCRLKVQSFLFETPLQKLSEVRGKEE